MPSDTEIDGLVEQLIAIHGEGGACPTAGDWRAILALDGLGPVHLLNLLTFHSDPVGDGAMRSGIDAYRAYVARVAGPFARAGGEVVVANRVSHLLASAVADEWDAVVFTRYPSARAVAAMWLDDEFIAAHENRIDGVERSQVLVLGHERI